MSLMEMNGHPAVITPQNFPLCGPTLAIPIQLQLKTKIFPFNLKHPDYMTTSAAWGTESYKILITLFARPIIYS